MAALSSVRVAGTPPIPRTSLIGREREIAAARAFLLDEAAPLLTLTGPGGVGKTRLALAVAQDVAGFFVDGVAFVDLAPLADPSLVAATVAATLEVTVGPDRSVSDAIVAHLRPKQFLLLLDNCEHLLVAAADLVATLLAGCPALQVLATSRAPLRVRGEQILPVPPLLVPPRGVTLLEAVRDAPAVTLFVQRARAVDPQLALSDANAVAIAEVCQRLDGLPLAIELAATRSAVLSPASMMALLNQRLPVLGTGPRDAPARQQTIHDTIAWSYGLLSPHEQSFFRALSVFASGWTLEAAAAVSGLALDNALDLLEELVNQSLVVRHIESDRESPRFTMLETIREFGLERLCESGDDAATRDRHAMWYLALAEAAEPHLEGQGHNVRQWIERLGTEVDNLRVAIERLIACGDDADVLRMVAGLTMFWFGRPLETQARRWLEAGIAARPSAPAMVLATAYYSLASTTGWLGDPEASIAWAEEGLAFARTQDDPAILARALLCLGWAWQHAGQVTRGIPLYEEAIALLRSTSNLAGLAIALVNLGEARSAAGDAVVAIPLLDEALAIYARIDDPTAHAMARINRAILAADQGEAERASELLRETLRKAQDMGDHRIELTAVACLAGVALGQGNVDLASRLLRDVATEQAASGIVRLVVDFHIQRVLADAQHRLGQLAEVTQRREPARPWSETIAEALSMAEHPGGSPQRPAATPPLLRLDLTRREREILSLLCQRLTDPEIAEQLFISPSTASKHVSNVLGKLGVANRRQAAAFAVRHGLV